MCEYKANRGEKFPNPSTDYMYNMRQTGRSGKTYSIDLTLAIVYVKSTSLICPNLEHLHLLEQ